MPQYISLCLHGLLQDFVDVHWFIDCCKEDIELDIVQGELDYGYTCLLDKEYMLEAISFFHGLDKAVKELLMGHKFSLEYADGIYVCLGEMHSQ